MTTILFNNKTQEIACDSRCTGGNGLIVSDEAIKAIPHGDDLWFMAGTCADMEALMNAEVDEQLPFQLECMAFVLTPEGFFTVYTNEEQRVRRLEMLYSEGAGSGSDFAIAALDLGLTTRAAVEYAMTRDCFSGGTVHVYNKDGIIDPDNSIE